MKKKTFFHSLKIPALRLYQQMIICFVVVVLLPLSGVTLVIYNINQKALKKELGKFTQHTAEAIYQDLQTEMSWQQDQFQILGATLLDKYQQTRNLTQSVTMLFQLCPSCESVGFYDTHGHSKGISYRPGVHVPTPLHLPTQMNPTKSQRFEVLFVTPKTPASNAYYLRGTFPVSSTTSQKNLAYYVIQKRFPYLQELMLANQKTLQDAVYLVDQTGRIIAGPAEAVAGKQRLQEKDYQFFQSLKPGVAREVETVLPASANTDNSDDDAQENLALETVFVKIPQIDWGIVIESPYHIRQKYVKRARSQSLLLVVGCLAGVILLALIYVWGISRNFRQLIKGIKAMAGGNYARRIRLITNFLTPYEIVYLAGEFNRMARRTFDAWESSQTLNMALLRRNEEEAFLNRVTKALHGNLSLGEIGRMVPKELSANMRAPFCALWVEPYGLSETSSAEESSLWIEDRHHIFSDIQHEQLLNWPQLNTDTDQPLVRQPISDNWLKAFGVGPALIYPVHFQEKRFGVVVLLRRSGAPVFSEEEVHVVGLVVRQLGVALNQIYQWQTIQDANAKLAKLDELKSNLIDAVSHELRTPLTSIKGYTSRLLRYDTQIDEATRQKSLKIVKQQADRLNRLVDDLLVIPDLEQDNLRVFPDWVQVKDIIERARQSVQEKEQREIQIYLPTAQSENILAMADPDRLEQVMVNLLDNAVKYSLPDTQIGVEVTSVTLNSSPKVHIRVYNQSNPIPKGELPTLFDKFKRLDESLTRTTRGSGLGLFITKGLVEAMGGNISVDYRNGYFEVLVSLATSVDRPVGLPV